VLPGEHSQAALAIAERDSSWVAPSLWRIELQNVLATSMRVRKLQLARALMAFAAADRLVTDTHLDPTTEECLVLAASGGVSAYDALFVFAAERLDTVLVTADRRLARAFPRRVTLAETFAARRS
jgi:predicted nucleic acid-binding protein